MFSISLKQITYLRITIGRVIQIGHVAVQILPLTVDTMTNAGNGTRDKHMVAVMCLYDVLPLNHKRRRR